HLAAISRMTGIRAVAIADINRERAEECAKKFDLKAYTDYEEMLAEQQPDIAIVALPHFLHRDAAISCLAAGCHLLLEKPMAISSAACDDIIEHAERFSRAVLVG